MKHTFRRGLALAMIAFASMMTACGGGGGSSSPAPSVNAPGAPGAPAAPGAPSATPTPASTPSPSTTPVTEPQQGITILPDTTGRFGLIQLTDDYGGNNGPMTAAQIQSEAPHYDAVWGAFQPAVWHQYAGHAMILSRYEVPFEDEYLITGHNVQWFQQNHPDWILYGCQSNGTPTSDYAWSGTGAAFGSDVPLNIHNSAVVTYEVNSLAQYMIANGYNAIAVDQMTFENFLLSPNPNLEGTGPNAGWYGCGYYPNGPANGNFQRVYGSASGGDLYAADQTFIQDEINWVQMAKQIFSTDYSSYNLKILVNHPPLASTPTSQEQQLLSYVDGTVDENGFTNYGKYTSSGLPSLFTNTLAYTQYLQSTLHKAVFITYYFCAAGNGSPCPTSAANLSGPQADWALATYAIANMGGADAYIVPNGVDSYSYRPEFAQTYGTPCGNYTEVGSNVYERRFENGLAIVNASYSPQSVTLPNHTYTDIEGRSVGGAGSTLNLQGSDGYMLLTTGGNGCS